METQRPIEIGEKEKYQPKYIIFLGRHAEPSYKSIFDQVGGEDGKKTDNFDESSLTLQGVIEASLFGPDLLRAVAQRMPKGKIKMILANTQAYRTKETAQIIKESLEKQAERLGREIEVEFEGPEKSSFLTESRDEDEDKTLDDFGLLVDSIRDKSLEGGNTVYLGVTHEAKLNNYLNSIGLPTDEVGTAEFLSITDLGNDKNRVSFRGNSIEV